MNRTSIEAKLLALKDAALAATKRADGAFYRGYLADDAVAVVPAGIFDKEQVVSAMAQGSAFRSRNVQDVRATALSPESGLVTYRATFEGRDGKLSEVFVTTVYERREGVWQGILYQQTPLVAVG